MQFGTENWQDDEETIHRTLEKAIVVILCATNCALMRLTII
jgi:hypothetical protein